jgi:CubicO group peptidase (beta-lactamase class C family)
MSHRVAALVALFVTTLISAIMITPTAAARTPLDRPAIDRYVADYLDRHGLPGASIVVVKDGRTIHSGGFGGRGADRISADTPMAIASVSKSFTAFAVLQLVGAGDLGLDDRVAEALPEFRVADPRAEQITVRQLLSHTSGLPNPVIVGPAGTLEQGVARISGWRLAADPGTRHAYSNANYWVAARLVEVVSGRSFPDYLRQRIFAPLGMASTHSVITTAEPDPGLQGGHVTAYGTAIGTREMVAMSGGAGGVITTARDMGRWLAMQNRQGVTADGRRLLSADLLRLSHRPQPGAGRGGLGWQLSGPGVSPARIGHSGNLGGYNAQADLVPSSGYGVAVLLNSFTTTREHAYEISSGIIDITEDRSVEIGTPVPTIIDLALGVATLAAAGLTVLGIRRAGPWVERRKDWPGWRFGLRLLPQLIMPSTAVLIFAVVPTLQNNSATAYDAFALWPAAIILVIVAAVAGAALTAARVGHRIGRRAG